MNPATKNASSPYINTVKIQWAVVVNPPANPGEPPAITGHISLAGQISQNGRFRYFCSQLNCRSPIKKERPAVAKKVV
jgi:hypothetical protein